MEYYITDRAATSAEAPGHAATVDIASGIDGKDGEGALPPAHRWRNATELSWQNPDGTWGEWRDLRAAPLTVRSQVILPSGHTRVTLSDGQYFDVQRGQRGESVTVDDTRLDSDGNTVVVFSDGRQVTVAAGRSAYQAWLAEGNEGSRADFLASLKGEPGDKGPPGDISAHDRLGYDGRTLSQQAEAGQTEPLERWQDPSGNDVSSLSHRGDARHRSLSLGVPVQATNELNPNAFYTSGADRLYSAARRFEVWHDSPSINGWMNSYSPFENRFGDCIKTKDDDGQRFTKLYIQVGEPFDSTLDFWLQTTTGGRRPVNIRIGVIDSNSEIIGWGFNGQWGRDDNPALAEHVGNGLWKLEGMKTEDKDDHSGWVIEYEIDLETQSEIRTGAVQAFGSPPGTRFEWEAASLTKHTAPELHQRWQWGEKVRIDPDNSLVMRDEATGEWTPITLYDGQIQVN